MRFGDGRTALITGGARGLGSRTALALAELGFHIAYSYVRSRSEAEELAGSLESTGVRALPIQADMAIPGDVQRMADQVERELGPISVLVNNAGPFVRERRDFAEYDYEDIDYLLRGNLNGVLQLNRLVIPGMRAAGWGRIIHFGFGHAMEARGWQHRAVYAAAKVALVSFTKSLALEEAPYGITVNMVCPGDIRGKHKELSIDDARTLRDLETPRGRPGSGEDVARVIAFLCDDRSDFLTGNVIDVTGGLDPIRIIPGGVAPEKQ